MLLAAILPIIFFAFSGRPYLLCKEIRFDLTDNLPGTTMAMRAKYYYFIFGLCRSFEKAGGRCCVLRIGMCECKTPTTEMKPILYAEVSLHTPASTTKIPVRGERLTENIFLYRFPFFQLYELFYGNIFLSKRLITPFLTDISF